MQCRVRRTAVAWAGYSSPYKIHIHIHIHRFMTSFYPTPASTQGIPLNQIDRGNAVKINPHSKQA